MDWLRRHGRMCVDPLKKSICRQLYTHLNRKDLKVNGLLEIHSHGFVNFHPYICDLNDINMACGNIKTLSFGICAQSKNCGARERALASERL
jgi:hypothetical protein